MKTPRLVMPAVYALFFLSGAAALVYEISWARQLGLLVGHTAQAASVVLGGYFAGLALGYWLAGRWAYRVRPLAGYGVAEIIAGLWAFAVPALLAGIGRMSWSDSLFSGSILGRALLALLVLLPSTAALGATLPLMAAFLARLGGKSTARLTFAYALNTLGAVTGVVAATAVLLVVVGVATSSYLAALISILCGLAALLLDGWLGTPQQSEPSPHPPASNTSPDSPPPSPTRPPLGGWGTLAALVGFVTLALEVLYTRLFSLVFHNSTYTFGAVVAVFLAALSLGSLAVALWGNPRTYGWLAAIGCGGGAVAVPLSILLFLHRTGLDYFSQGDSLATYLLAALGLVAMVVLPPVTLLGMVLPAIWGAAKWNEADPHKPADPARTIGMLTAINTVAATLGSLAAGFLLVPLAGLWGALAVVSALAALGALSWLFAARRPGLAFGGAALAAVAIFAFLHVAGDARERVYATFRTQPWKLLAHWEGPYGWTDVVEIPSGEPYLSLRQNVHYGLGSDGPSTQREYLQAHLPLLLHPNPRQVAFLGLGTGLTAAPVAVHQEVESADVVELIPEVVEAARLFQDTNLGVVDNPKVNIVVDDARHHLLTTDRRYDVIISDLFVPWESETGYLYTVEHYRVARARLNAGGLFCQWLALYQMGPRELEMIADSFAAVFPHTTLWWGRLSPDTPMLALIGSEAPLGPLDLPAIEARLQLLGETTGGPADRYLGSAENLLRLSLGRWPRRENVPLNTDEHPRVEFLAPASHRGRLTLRQTRLRDYYDEVLSRLPPSGIEGDATPDDAARRRAWQRIRLSYD